VRSPRGAVVGIGACAAGAALLIAGLLLLPSAPRDFGDPATIPATIVVSAASSAGYPAVNDTGLRIATTAPPTDPPVADDVSMSGAADQTPTAAPSGVPVALHLPTLQLSSTVMEVVAVDGVLQVPADPLKVGWWIGSAPAGSSTGTTVIDGHIDSAAAGLGVFAHLTDLEDGDLVVVDLASGATVTYQVQARRTYRKTDGLPAEIFDSAGPARLVLITCGGQFDTDRKSYDDNVIVFANPIATAAAG